MTFELQSDTSAAAWLARAGTPGEQLLLFGPTGFEAYARLRFIPDPEHPGQAEADVQPPAGHESDIDQARRALRELGRFTETPDECCFCVWEGYPDVKPPTGEVPLLTLPHRRYWVLRGALADLGEWENELGTGHPIAPPAFVWPADRAWCFASDVDPHWAGIGASSQAVESLVKTPGIDVVRAQPEDCQPFYR
ncbi:hypothetical protein AB0F91_20385 [Amycolatopsis sp. NPDC023774]|uniref:hypothetical protein n=1 Tax=Amycolatopsis sp. NPDC023774 TaxID=3155015 RepID=UPI0033EDF3F8